MIVTKVSPVYQPSKWFLGLRYKQAYLINVEDGKRVDYPSVDAAWEAKGRLDILV